MPETRSTIQAKAGDDGMQPCHTKYAQPLLVITDVGILGSSGEGKKEPGTHRSRMRVITPDTYRSRLRDTRTSLHCTASLSPLFRRIQFSYAVLLSAYKATHEKVHAVREINTYVTDS